MNKLDKDEEEILEKFEKGVLSSSINAKKEINYAKIAEHNYLQSNYDCKYIT